MTDADHVRAIRNAVLAIQDAKRTLKPLYAELNLAEEAAKEAGLEVVYPMDDDRISQPTISRTKVY
jgi:hypothetical protein